jgi:hypothetical protein
VLRLPVAEELLEIGRRPGLAVFALLGQTYVPYFDSSYPNADKRHYVKLRHRAGNRATPVIPRLARPAPAAIAEVGRRRSRRSTPRAEELASTSNHPAN